MSKQKKNVQLFSNLYSNVVKKKKKRVFKINFFNNSKNIAE